MGSNYVIRINLKKINNALGFIRCERVYEIKCLQVNLR